MDSDTRAEVETLIDAKVQGYFNVALTTALPAMVEVGIRAHNSDIEAHGGLQMKTAQTKWAVRGVIGLLLIMSGAGIERAFGVFF